MTKISLRREVVAQVHTDIVNILTAQPGQTIYEISAKLSIPMSVSFVCGIIGMMKSLSLIYPSGEVRRGNVYAIRYSLGVTGPFERAPERDVKKPKRVKSIDMHVIYTPEVKTKVKRKDDKPVPKGSWLQGLGL